MKWSLEIRFFIEENKLAMKLTRYIPPLPAQAGMENGTWVHHAEIEMGIYRLGEGI